MQKIAIIGATGMIGQPVTHELIKAGFEITLLVRNIQKANQIFGSDVKLVKGDLKNINSIQELLIDQDGLYLNLSVEQNSAEKYFQPERDGLENILTTIKYSSVRRIGYLSSLVHNYQGMNGFNWWAFKIKQDAVAKIKKSDVPYSIFYPSTFMECFDKGAYRQGNKIVLAGNSKYKMYFIAGKDYGKQVAKTFQLNNESNEYVVQGTEAFTADEAAKFYLENCTNKKLKIVNAPIGVLKFLGNFSNKLNYGANICEALNNYPESFEADKTWKELGLPETKFIDYINQSQ